MLSNDAVRMLAQADTYELVQQVREMFADFYALVCTLDGKCTTALTVFEYLAVSLFLLPLSPREHCFYYALYYARYHTLS